SSPRPRCENRAARPRPAARPATGPIHERLGAAAGVAAEAGVCVAAGWRGACWGVAWRCMPKLLPPPRRLASASGTPKPNDNTATIRVRKRFFIFGQSPGSDLVATVQGDDARA